MTQIQQTVTVQRQPDVQQQMWNLSLKKHENQISRSRFDNTFTVENIVALSENSCEWYGHSGEFERHDLKNI